MNKAQGLVLAVCVGVFAILAGVLPTKPAKIAEAEKKRSLSFSRLDPDSRIAQERERLEGQLRTQLQALELEAQSDDDSLALEATKRLSGFWFDAGKPWISGYYARKVAEKEGTEEAWSIAGTTFLLCLQGKELEESIRGYCFDEAVAAFEAALSLNPKNLDNRINLSLVYVESPPEDNPMKGIRMLLDLSREYPESAAVLNQLGRLALQTGQIDKALERLEAALQLEPQNPKTLCLLARAYQQAGDTVRAARFEAACAGGSGSVQGVDE